MKFRNFFFRKIDSEQQTIKWGEIKFIFENYFAIFVVSRKLKRRNILEQT